MAAGFGIAFVFAVAFPTGGAVGKDNAFQSEVAGGLNGVGKDFFVFAFINRALSSLVVDWVVVVVSTIGFFREASCSCRGLFNLLQFLVPVFWVDFGLLENIDKDGLEKVLDKDEF